MKDEKDPNGAGRGDRFGRSKGGEEMVGRLVRLASPGPEIPADGRERIKAALRPEWRQAVAARRRRRRLLWAGGGLAAAASLILGVVLWNGIDNGGRATVGPVAHLALVAGNVEIVPPSGAPWHGSPDDLGEAILSGSWLRTDEGSRVALDLGAGRSLRLDVGSRLRIASESAVLLDRGAVYIDSGEAGNAGIEVRTTLGIARELGTQFELRRMDDTLTIRVREGSVSFDRNGDRLEIAHGSSVRVSSDGSVERGLTRPNSAEWNWVLEAAPALEIEGRTVVAFLDWVARESGLWVRFADAEVERLAATTILHGSVEGLTPKEAAEAVLPGCGLQGSFEGDTLVIKAL
jgi:ferric-dicitrate binding protein FerR (iron transport regulator)